MRKGFMLMMIMSILFSLISCTASYDVNNNEVIQESENILEQEENQDLLYETNLIIHDNLSDFVLQARGTKGEPNSYEDITIINALTNEVINEYHLEEDTLFEIPINGENLDVMLIDVNFDGYKDIVIFDCHNGNWNRHYLYYVWDINSECFVSNKELSELGLPGFDEENQLIYSMARGSASDHWYYTHQYINGELVKIKEISDNGIRNVTQEQLISFIPDSSIYSSLILQCFVEQELNYDTMELEIVVSKYKIYDYIEWKLLAEYDTDSEIGQQLSKLYN